MLDLRILFFGVVAVVCSCGANGVELDMGNALKPSTAETEQIPFDQTTAVSKPDSTRSGFYDLGRHYRPLPSEITTLALTTLIDDVIRIGDHMSLRDAKEAAQLSAAFLRASTAARNVANNISHYAESARDTYETKGGVAAFSLNQFNMVLSRLIAELEIVTPNLIAAEREGVLSKRAMNDRDAITYDNIILDWLSIQLKLSDAERAKALSALFHIAHHRFDRIARSLAEKGR